MDRTNIDPWHPSSPLIRATGPGLVIGSPILQGMGNGLRSAGGSLYYGDEIWEIWMNRKTWVGLIVGVAVVGGLAFAVWTQRNLGPPSLKALAGMKPHSQVPSAWGSSDRYFLRSSSEATRQGIDAQLRDLGFKDRSFGPGIRDWHRPGWSVQIVQGFVTFYAGGVPVPNVNADSSSPIRDITVIITPVRELTLLDRLKIWLGL